LGKASIFPRWLDSITAADWNTRVRSRELTTASLDAFAPMSLAQLLVAGQALERSLETFDAITRNSTELEEEKSNDARGPSLLVATM
jgi:hypothetical protein